MKNKQYYIFTILLIMLMSITACTNELDELDGRKLIEQYALAGSYKIQVTPKMMGMVAITSGEHDAELIHEGGDILRLKFTGFKKDPMPFEMSVNILMRVKPSANGELIIENIGGDFDADLPNGQAVLDPNDIPDGIEIPDDALINGLHSNGKSSIAGTYKMITNPTGEKSMNFNWDLQPNIGLPVVVNIISNKKTIK